jgi:uncharacterized protein YndB with AHSA1/START domain
MKLTEISVSRMIAAPPEDVFNVWMDPQSPGGPWFGAERTILNAFVDGLFYQAVQHEGRSWHHYGRFTEIDRPHSVQYTWVSEATKGLESIVSVTFQRNGAGTEVTLRHTGIPDDELGRRHKDGWGWVLSMLADRFVPSQSSASQA